MIQISVPKETKKGETRVAATPESISRFLKKYKDVEFLVEKGAGLGANFTDAEYEAVGAKLGSTKQAFAGDVVLKVTAPTESEAKGMNKGSLLIGNLDPSANEKVFKTLAKQNVHAIACERIPRISRAQAMDTLSSQANIGGYRSVLEAAEHYDRFMPVMMTAAGSSKPAKVIVLGVGVAGLQAIATARRLGASVSAFDVRPEVKEQVESLGAKFLDLGLEESGSGEGGYAKELSEEGKKKQQEALQEALKKADIVITTAQIPGRPAPVLVTEDAVKGMAPGSVIIDMAAGGYNAANGVKGGNCPLSKADEVVEVGGVKIVGHTNYAAFMPKDASAFFAKNLTNLLALLVDVKEDSASLNINLEDEIVAKSLVVYEGEVK